MNKASSKKHVVIIGAGPAGLTAAYKLGETNTPCTVLEKDNIVGGISRTVDYKGYLFDIGGHRFFSKVSIINRFWNDILGSDLIRCSRLSRIYYNRKFFHYPLRPLNALLGLGFINSILIVSSYFWSQLFPFRTEGTFEHWVSNRFGKRLYNIFFKTYTEKVWGMPCNEIRSDWAAQRIKGLTLFTAIKHSIIPRSTQRAPGSSKPKIKTLIDNFAYPRKGPGMMWNAVAQSVRQSGNTLHLDTTVDRIIWTDSEVEGVEVVRNGFREIIQGSDFLSTMPIRELVNKLHPSPPEDVVAAANSLKYRDFLTVALIVNCRDVFPDNWIYIHEPGVKVGRIQNFKNWSPEMVPDPDTTCLGLEYFCNKDDDLWNMADEDLLFLGRTELEQLGLVESGAVIDGTVVRMPKAYPVYDLEYQESLAVVRRFLGRFNNLQLIGRNGMHKYNNQDHSMLTAMLAVRNILGERIDVWTVNDDHDYHEEVTTHTGEDDVDIRELAKTQPLTPTLCKPRVESHQFLLHRRQLVPAGLAHIEKRRASTNR